MSRWERNSWRVNKICENSSTEVRIMWWEKQLNPKRNHLIEIHQNCIINEILLFAANQKTMIDNQVDHGALIDRQLDEDFFCYLKGVVV